LALTNAKKFKARVKATYEQAQAFLDEYGDILPPQSKKIAETYAQLPLHRKPIRVWKIIRFNFKKQNFISVVGQLVFC